MDTAQKIRQSVDEVSRLRAAAAGDAQLAACVSAVKRLQARRFEGTYADLLARPPYADAARFFLDELYGDRDFAARDAQFARIAGAVERLFPADVAATAVALAELHALTERLDHAMGRAWPATDANASHAARYVQAWRAVQRRDERGHQLATVMAIGAELKRFTRTPGLRLMLRMMRGPAAAAGLDALQRFLETGFDTFAAMAKKPDGVAHFLDTIRQREAGWIDRLFDGDPVACETGLAHLLGEAR